MKTKGWWTSPFWKDIGNTSVAFSLISSIYIMMKWITGYDHVIIQHSPYWLAIWQHGPSNFLSDDRAVFYQYDGHSGQRTVRLATNNQRGRGSGACRLWGPRCAVSQSITPGIICTRLLQDKNTDIVSSWWFLCHTLTSEAWISM